MEIQEWLATATSKRFESDGSVAPPYLKKGIFSVGALDNLDHNPSSTTATSSFHGTGISIFQFATETNPGESQPLITIPPPLDLLHILSQKAMLLSHLQNLKRQPRQCQRMS